jgi:quaternary ammonium compound-resistance protein SugE
MAWLMLVAAGLLEAVWAVALKQSDGLGINWATIIFAVAAVASFVLLAQALKSLPVSGGYAVWTGIGAVGAGILGMTYLGEPAQALRIVGIALVTGGIVCLALTDAR